MLKRILLLIALFTNLTVSAAENYLNSVVISKTEDETSVILRTDNVSKVKKEIITSDKIILNLKSVTQAANITTLYKNVSDVNGLVIQNQGNNSLKIYIEAPGISKANVVFETPDSAPYAVNELIGGERAGLCIASLIILLAIMRSAKNRVSKESQTPDINEINKEREKAMYRNFRKEIASVPNINYKLKSYRKHVLKGETIRAYENRLSAKV